MLFVERAGAGAPVILVHGFLGSSRMWAPVVSHLAQSFDVIAIDLAGFGRDTTHTTPDRIEDFARAVIDTVDGLELDRFHMIGHSTGGMIVQQIALECGSRVMRLVLYGTAGSGRLPLRFEPIAVIGGDADRSTPPEELLGLYRGLRHAELCILLHCAHAAHLERTDLFNSAIGHFLMTADPS